MHSMHMHSESGTRGQVGLREHHLSDLPSCPVMVAHQHSIAKRPPRFVAELLINFTTEGIGF